MTALTHPPRASRGPAGAGDLLGTPEAEEHEQDRRDPVEQEVDLAAVAGGDGSAGRQVARGRAEDDAGPQQRDAAVDGPEERAAPVAAVDTGARVLLGERHGEHRHQHDQGQGQGRAATAVVHEQALGVVVAGEPDGRDHAEGGDPGGVDGLQAVGPGAADGQQQ
ncbi:hypothetical protein GXW82_11070 [Streptacidiphilus sp. 4-A2]|nr:hypothetical protein [Streptacidiphilus sp. 4-A2]